MGDLSIEQFGQKIKTTHPEYADMGDADVGQKVLAKYPQYQDMIAAPNAGLAPPAGAGTPEMPGIVSRFMAAAGAALSPEPLKGKTLKDQFVETYGPSDNPRSPFPAPSDYVNQVKSAVQRGQSGDWAGAAGQITPLALQVALGAKGLKSNPPGTMPKIQADPQTAATKLTAALGSNVESAVQKAAPQLQEIARTNPPKTVGEFTDAVQKASLALENKFQSVLTPNKTGKVPLDTIADAIEAKITPAMEKFNPEMADAIRETAGKYRGQTATLEELNGLRDMKNSALQGLYQKEGLKRSQAMRDPRYAHQFAEIETAKDLLYSELDRLNPGMDIKGLKQQQSGLLSLLEEAQSAGNKLSVRDAKVTERPLPSVIQNMIEGMHVTRPATLATKPYRAINPKLPSDAPNAQIRSAMKRLK